MGCVQNKNWYLVPPRLIFSNVIEDKEGDKTLFACFCCDDNPSLRHQTGFVRRGGCIQAVTHIKFVTERLDIFVTMGKKGKGGRGEKQAPNDPEHAIWIITVSNNYFSSLFTFSRNLPSLPPAPPPPTSSPSLHPSLFPLWWFNADSNLWCTEVEEPGMRHIFDEASTRNNQGLPECTRSSWASET